jgi:hypothetical protein
MDNIRQLQTITLQHEKAYQIKPKKLLQACAYGCSGEAFISAEAVQIAVPLSPSLGRQLHDLPHRQDKSIPHSPRVSMEPINGESACSAIKRCRSRNLCDTSGIAQSPRLRQHGPIISCRDLALSLTHRWIAEGGGVTEHHNEIEPPHQLLPCSPFATIASFH